MVLVIIMAVSASLAVSAQANTGAAPVVPAEDTVEIEPQLSEEEETLPPVEEMSDDQIISMLFRNSYDVFEQYRNEVGVYRDSILLFDGEPYHPSSIAATGIGLMSLAIADKKGWNENALEDAILTVKTMTGHTEGFKPDASPNGFIKHFIDMETGEAVWNCEYSSIDTAILVTGALFAKKYFNNAELSCYVDELYHSIDFQDALASLETGGMYMIMDADGKGDPGAITLPFNEYIIVAWLAYNQHINEPDSLAVKMWDKWFKTTDNILKKDYEGFSLLTDHVNRFLPSFTWLFPYYMVNMFSSSPVYEQYIENAYKADKLWGINTGGESYEWGNGAGNNQHDGYHADAINNNEELTVSPHIVAGFIPVNPSGRDDLIALYKNNKGVYKLPSNGKEILWRYSRADLAWESDSIQAIDYSTFLFGLAAQDEELGMKFFKENNDFFETSDNKGNGGGNSGGSGGSGSGTNNENGSNNGYDSTNEDVTEPKKINVTSIKAQSSLSLVKGKKAKLPCVIYPINAANKKLTYSTSNKKVASVSKTGTIEAHKTGKAVITITSSNGKTIKCTVYVVSKAIKLKEIILNKNGTVTLAKKKTLNLSAKSSPKNATGFIVKWKSSNSKVASVDAMGRVTAKAKGTVKITAEVGNKKKTIIIKVK